MPRILINDGEEIISSDLSTISAALERELYDRVLYEMMSRQSNFVFKDSLTCSNVNATTSKVKAGVGFQTDGTQTDPEPQARQLYLGTDTNVTHLAADATNPRIDLICVQAARATTKTAARNFKDPSTGVVTTPTQNVETDWAPTLQVVAGSPAGSPSAPATPSGWIALAQVLVAASTGIAGSSSYTDVRPRFKKGSGWKSVQAVTSSTTADIDAEVITVDATTGSVVLTLPAVAAVLGKEYHIVRIDSSANTATVKGNGSELILDQNSQGLTGFGSSLNPVAISSTLWGLF